MRASKWFSLLAVGVFAVALALGGCGSDGKDGINGVNGANGQDGQDGLQTLVNTTAEPAGENCTNGGQKIESGLDTNRNGVLDPEEVTNTSYVCGAAQVEESCAVCHGSGRDWDVADFHPDPALPDIVISDIVLHRVLNAISVSFHVEATADGAPVTGLTFDDCRFYISDIVPAGTATGNAPVDTWDSPYLERWAYESSSASTPTGTFDTSDAANGNYSYDFVTTLAQATIEAPEYSPTHVQRLVVRADGRDYGYNRRVGFIDFMVPLSGQDSVDLGPTRVIVDRSACINCHNDPLENAAHGSGYQTPQVCNQCHTPIGTTYGDEMQEDEAWLASLVHKIHAAIPMDAFPDRIGGKGYGAVTFPQDVKNCLICHADKGQDLADNWKSNPTAQVCGTCHVDVDFETGEGHGGGQQLNNTFCAACHPAEGPITDIVFPVAAVHDITPTGVNVPEFDVTLTLTPPINGTYYVAGGAPLATVTLKNHGDGSDINPAFYTNPQGDAGNTADTALRVASIYIYGPRALALPVLATGSTTDPDLEEGTAPTQGHNLFTGGTDPQVETDATGFKYRLMAIPEDLEDGTYMVRVRIGDYGRVGSGDYHIESFAFTNIQIGTATVEEKVAGDNCVSCHGTGTAPFHDERHAVVFDTDECLSCHDLSGNHAIPLNNRVHAIHAASMTGDAYPGNPPSRDWEEVTYPRDIENCMGCHTSGNTSYLTNIYQLPCLGCHGDNPGATPHMKQNGGRYQ